jgi:hypothetical protein
MKTARAQQPANVILPRGLARSALAQGRLSRQNNGQGTALPQRPLPDKKQ